MDIKEIKELELRIKATVLLTLQGNIDNVKQISEITNLAIRCFDDGYYELAKQNMALLDEVIISLLELTK